MQKIVLTYTKLGYISNDTYIRSVGLISNDYTKKIINIKMSIITCYKSLMNSPLNIVLKYCQNTILFHYYLSQVSVLYEHPLRQSW